MCVCICYLYKTIKQILSRYKLLSYVTLFQDCSADVSVAGLAVFAGVHLPEERRGGEDHGDGDVAVPHAAAPRHQVRVRRLARLD